MHPQAREYVKSAVSGMRFTFVVEFGSLDINGSVRDLFDTPMYHGIDLQDGPGVDEIADVTTWTSDKAADCIVCCEVMEHAPDVPAICRSAFRSLARGGLFIVTCATGWRAPHSAIDGGYLRDGEHYANVAAQDLKAWCKGAGLTVTDWSLDWNHNDLYLTAVKP